MNFVSRVCLICLYVETTIELLDLPDEMILAILNKIQPEFERLCSLVGIGNRRLEQLAIDGYQSIDLTFDYYKSPWESTIERFYSLVLPRIGDKIQSLALSVQHLSDVTNFVEANGDGTLPNLTQLKIVRGRRIVGKGTPCTTGILSLIEYEEI